MSGVDVREGTRPVRPRRLGALAPAPPLLYALASWQGPEYMDFGP